AAEDAGVMELIEHALDPVRMLADVFEKKDSAVDAWKIRRTREMRHEREVAAPEHPLGLEARRTVQRKSSDVLATEQQAPAMLQRECRRRLSAEIIRRERAGKRDHAGCRQGGELEGGEIAVAEPTFPCGADARQI